MLLEHAFKLAKLFKVAFLNLACGNSRPKFNYLCNIAAFHLCGKGSRLKPVVLHFKLKRLCLCGGKFFIVDGFLLLKRVNFVLNGTKLLAAYLILLKLLVGKGGAGTGFIQKVNCLIRQKTVVYISFRKANAAFNKFVAYFYMVEFFIVRGNSFKNLHAVRNAGFFHGNRLKAALKSSVFFNMLSVFAECCGADYLNFSP